MKRFFLFIYILAFGISKEVFAQKNTYKNTVFLYRQENGSDSTLVNEGFYCFIDSSNYLSFAFAGFRYNEFYSDIDSAKNIDSTNIQYKLIEKYSPHNTSPFQLTKTRSGLDINYLEND